MGRERDVELEEPVLVGTRPWVCRWVGSDLRAWLCPEPKVTEPWPAGGWGSGQQISLLSISNKPREIGP